MARSVVSVVQTGIVVCLCAWAGQVQARCMDRALERLDLPVHEREVVFLEPESSITRSWRLDVPRCVSVLALATRPHTSVDATLRADSGQDLSQDGSETPHAYVRFCGAEGIRLHWTITVSAPTEVEVVALEGAPARLPDWGRDVGECFAGAPGMRIPDPELGAPPPAPTGDERIARRASELDERGYRQVTRESVAFSERHERSLELEGGHCYAMWAIPDIGAVDAVLTGPDGRELAVDRRPDVDAGIGYCPLMSGTFTWVIHDAGGVEEVHVLFVEQAAPSNVPSGLNGPAMRAYVESTRSHALRPVGWVHLEQGDSIRLPLPPSEGCRSVVAIPAEESWARGAFTLQLLGDDGALLASTDRSPLHGGIGLAHECAGDARAVRILGRRGHGRVWVGVRSEP